MILPHEEIIARSTLRVVESTGSISYFQLVWKGKQMLGTYSHVNNAIMMAWYDSVLDDEETEFIEILLSRVEI